jgi:hypothetical protein
MNKEYKGVALSGELFNQLFTDHYVVLVDKDDKLDYNNVAHTGLNDKYLNITNIGTTQYAYGGIEFFDEASILLNVCNYSFPTHYRTVNVPENGTQVYIDTSKFRGDKIHLCEKKPLGDMSIWDDEDFCNSAIAKDVKFVQYCRNITEQRCIEIIEDKPALIEIIPIKTPEVYLAAVLKNGFMIRYVPPEKQTIEMCWVAFSHNYRTFESIHCQEIEMCFLAVQQSGILLEYVKEQTSDICIDAVEQNWKAIEFVRNQTLDICQLACIKSVKALEFCKVQTKEMCMDILATYPLMLDCVLEQDIEICNLAVEKNYLALKYAKFQDDDTCLRVVSRDGLQLQYVKNKTPEICIMAINHNIKAFEFIDNPSESMCVKVVIEDGEQLQHIKNQTIDICTAAIVNTWKAIIFTNQDDLNDDDVQFCCTTACSLNTKALQYCKYQNEDMIETAVKDDGMNLKYALFQTQIICNAAVNNDVRAIQYVEQQFQTVELCMKAVEKDGMLIEHISNTTNGVSVAAVYNKPDAFKFLKNPCEDACIAYVCIKGMNLQYIPEEYQTETICMMAVSETAYAIRYAKVQNEDICETVCNFSANLIEHCKVRTQAMLIKVCGSSGIQLSELTTEEKTPEVCLAAVNNWGSALEHVPTQTPKICLAAVKNCGGAFKYVKDEFKTAEMSDMSVTHMGCNIQYVKKEHQTDELCIKAIDKVSYNIKHIVDPSEKILQAAFKDGSYNINHLDEKYKTITNKLAAIYYNASAVIQLNKEKDKEFYIMAMLLNPTINTHAGHLSPEVISFVSEHPYMDYIKTYIKTGELPKTPKVSSITQQTIKEKVDAAKRVSNNIRHKPKSRTRTPSEIDWDSIDDYQNFEPIEDDKDWTVNYTDPPTKEYSYNEDPFYQNEPGNRSSNFNTGKLFKPYKREEDSDEEPNYEDPSELESLESVDLPPPNMSYYS